MIMDLLKFCEDLYYIPRSLTGKGVEQTLKYIKKEIPIEIKKIKSGTKVFDWTIPPEWNLKEAYIVDLNTGEKIIDIKNHNLHLVGYSEPVKKVCSYEELSNNLYYIENQPDAIPYLTSYYFKRWGFCLSYNQFKTLDKNANYKVYVDSSFNKNGNLTYGELLINGEVKQEILFSSYICHPQMVNNELSGPAVLTALAKEIMKKDNYYSYRFILVPETIGSIAYISKNLNYLKENVIGGYNITCVGDERSWGFVPTRYGNTLSDKIAEHVLKSNNKKYKKFSWLDRGSDERQYCSPGVDLPICCITRSKWDEYPEYHTSEDNFDLVTRNGLNESLEIYRKCVEVFELGKNILPKINVYCEPHLGNRGLHPNFKTDHSKRGYRDIKNFISYCDGENTIMEIADLCNLNFIEAYTHYNKLVEANLIEM